MRRKIFEDRQLESAIENAGYVVVPGLLNFNETEQLLNAYKTVAPAQPNGFHVSNFLQEAKDRLFLSSNIRNIVGHKISPFVYNYKPLLGLMYVKEPGEEKDFYFHLDCNVIDERNQDSISVWVALQDMDKENGTLVMLRGSQNEKRRLRGSPMFYLPAYDEQQVIAKYPTEALQLKRGDAVIWTHRLFHGSLKNQTGNTRIAASLIMVPQEATPVHFYKNSNGQIEMYKAEESFYVNNNFGERPSAETFLRLVEDVSELVD